MCHKNRKGVTKRPHLDTNQIYHWAIENNMLFSGNKIHLLFFGGDEIQNLHRTWGTV